MTANNVKSGIKADTKADIDFTLRSKKEKRKKILISRTNKQTNKKGGDIHRMHVRFPEHIIKVRRTFSANEFVLLNTQ